MTITDDNPAGRLAAMPADPDTPEMAKGEKIAWLAIMAMTLCYGGYFIAVYRAEQDGTATFLRFFLLLGIASLIRALIEGVGQAVIALRSPEGRAKPDERDRAIGRRGAAVAYYVLMTGMVIVGMFMPFTNSSWQIVNAALFSLALSELVRCIIVVRSYRRGWHG